ncbi:MAG: hypothetical protein M3M94_04885 [Actinomycetota bacterium]|nr:hypothetical protein [Actinomycetota bacterium]
MGDWYTIGLAAGLGVGVGVLVAALLGFTRTSLAAAVGVALAAALGVAVGHVVDDWDEAVGGLVGATLGSIGGLPLVRGTLRRGGTAGATALLVALAGVVLAVLAFVPIVGYVEALLVPALAARLRRRGGDRYAGLRILARD